MSTKHYPTTQEHHLAKGFGLNFQNTPEKIQRTRISQQRHARQRKVLDEIAPPLNWVSQK